MNSTIQHSKWLGHPCVKPISNFQFKASPQPPTWLGAKTGLTSTVLPVSVTREAQGVICVPLRSVKNNQCKQWRRKLLCLNKMHVWEKKYLQSAVFLEKLKTKHFFIRSIYRKSEETLEITKRAARQDTVSLRMSCSPKVRFNRALNSTPVITRRESPLALFYCLSEYCSCHWTARFDLSFEKEGRL